MLGLTRDRTTPSPERKQIDAVLALLSNPILDILTEEGKGYILTLSIDAARRRLLALAGFFASQD